jgi:ribosomal protein S27AE
MKQAVLYVGLAAMVLLMAGIFALLFQVTRNGVPVNVTGAVSLANATTGVTGTVKLDVPEAINLVATGPDKGAVPADLALATCPKCGGSMIPVRFNLITGAIEWKCLQCGYTVTAESGTSP